LQKVNINTSLGCCDRKAQAASTQTFALWQQATTETIHHDHSIIACSCHAYRVFLLVHIPSVVNHAFQRNPSGVVATTSPPFYNEPHRSHVLCVKAAPSTTFTSWSQHHFVAIGKPKWQAHKASHCGSKQQQRSHAAITLLLLVRATHILCFS